MRAADFIAADLTTVHSVGERVRARARLVAKAKGVLAGLDLFEAVLLCTDPGVQIERHKQDGDRLAPGEVVAQAQGGARALLVAERTALNFVQRLSGIASLTRRFVDACANSRGGAAVRILDTRKTTPTLRALEKYAVRCGGGTNHRFGLFDEAMVKNNHADLAGVGLVPVIARLRERLGERVKITCEARDEGEARAGIEGGADVILLDNFTPRRIAACLPALRDFAAGRAASRQHLAFEASGGITLENAPEFAASGVERISIGGLTHSAAALDFSLYLEPVP